MVEAPSEPTWTTELVGWLKGPGWKVEVVQDPAHPLRYRVRTPIALEVYRPSTEPQSLVILTSFNLSPHELSRCLQLKSESMYDLIWDLKCTLLQADLFFHFLPSAMELDSLVVAAQLWEPVITKGNLLRETFHVSNAPPMVHALIERHLNEVERWVPESDRVLIPDPGQRPELNLGL